MGDTNFFLRRLRILSVFIFLTIHSFSLFSADITLNFCPVTKIQASKDWAATFTIQNNTAVVLDFATNEFSMVWPSLITLPYPFSNGVQSDITWSFNIDGVYDWQSKLPVGATYSKAFTGGKFSGVLQFPTSGTFTQGGITYSVEVKNCNQTQNFELYDATFKFKRECFIYSPAKLCLGQGATEIWRGEGVFDAMIPTDRPSWAIADMVAHRLFTNLVGQDIVSPNFWMATAMNESRMTCDPTIVPNATGGHCKINSMANSCTGISNTTNNCFQVLNIGYSQISNNQPDLFSQTNTYGTASFSNVIDNGNWETGALAVAYYHYQDIRYWDQIYCFNIPKTWKDAKDPYAIEKIFYHAYHDGPNAGISLLNDIKANYAAATSATNMNTVIGTGGTWSQILSGGSSQKVGNFTSLLDGGSATLYPTSKVDNTTQYHGCYNAPTKWTDVLYYLDRIKILYPQVKTPAIEAAIKAVYDGINGGATVNFEDLGPVIDEIVIQMGGHDPSKYIATQFSASKTCPVNALGISLRTNDTICPGTTGTLQVWLSGDKNFKVILKYPDNSLHTFSNIDYSPYNIPITQPGAYEVTYFEDNATVGNPNCLFSKLTVQSKNGNVVTWDKTKVTGTGNSKCATGDLILKNTGPSAVTITYKKDGGAPQTVNIGAGVLSKTVLSPATAGQYIITAMTPNSCGTPINDTINICGSCVKPSAVISGGAAICPGDSVMLSVALTGAPNWKLRIKNGASIIKVSNITSSPYQFYAKSAGTYLVDTVWDDNCDTLGIGIGTTVSLKSIPTATISGTATICQGDSTQLSVALTGAANWKLKIKSGTNVYSTVSGISAIPYSFWVKTAGIYKVDSVWDNVCRNVGDVATAVVTVNSLPTIGVSGDTSICPKDTAKLTLTLTGTAPYNIKASLGLVSVNFTSATNTYVVPLTELGTYTLLVTDAKGCKKSKQVSIIAHTPPTVSIGDTIKYCTGGSTLVTATAGFSSYLWSTGSVLNTQTVNGATVSPLWLQVTDANGCKARDSAVTKQAQLSVNIGPADTTLCFGASLTLDPSTTFNTYSWTGVKVAGTKSIVATSAGYHKLKVTDIAGCSAVDSINVIINPQLTISLGTSDTLYICPGGSVTITPVVSPGVLTYAWSNKASGTASFYNATLVGWHTVKISDALTCSNKDSVYVKENGKLLFSMPNKTICVGDSTVLNPGYSGAGYVFAWNTGDITPTKTIKTNGVYGVVVTYNGTCSGSDSMTLTSFPIADVNLGADSIKICAGATTSIDAGGAFVSYVWSSTENTKVINNKGAGKYIVNVIDNNGCRDKDSVIVDVRALPTVALGRDIDTCSGVTILLPNLSPQNGVTYSWTKLSGGAAVSTPTLNISTSDTYILMVTDLNLCSKKDSVVANFRTVPIADLGFTNDTTTVCVGDVLTLDAKNPGMTYLWNDGTKNATLSSDGEGLYYVKVSNGMCNDADSIYIKEITLPHDVLNDTLNAVSVNYCFAEETAHLSAASIDGVTYDYLWSTGSSAQAIDVKAEGVYDVTISANSCSTRSEWTFIDYCPTTFYVPNSFTPNGDAHNETFAVVGLNMEDFEMLIFNRWGELIYKSNNPQEAWDGNAKGRKVQEDVYVWRIHYGVNLPSGKIQNRERIGHVTVLY